MGTDQQTNGPHLDPLPSGVSAVSRLALLRRLQRLAGKAGLKVRRVRGLDFKLKGYEWELVDSEGNVFFKGDLVADEAAYRLGLLKPGEVLCL